MVPWATCKNWFDLGSSDHTVDDFLGQQECTNCRCSTIRIYRTFTLGTKGDVVQSQLRFEQERENGAGRMVLTVPIPEEWQVTFTNQNEEGVPGKWNGVRGDPGEMLYGKRYDIFKKEHLAWLHCIGCMGVSSVALKAVRLDGETEVRRMVSGVQTNPENRDDDNIPFDEEKAALL